MTIPHNTPQPDPDLPTDLDRLFDRELSQQERAELDDRLRADPAATEHFRQTTRVVLALRQPLQTPDLTDSILAHVHDRPSQRFHRRSSHRRHAYIPRIAAAAACVGLGAGIMFVVLPDPQPTPTLPPVAARSSPALSLLRDAQLAEQELAGLRLDPITFAESPTASSLAFDPHITPELSLHGLPFSPQPLALSLDLEAAPRSFDQYLLGSASSLQPPRPDQDLLSTLPLIPFWVPLRTAPTPFLTPTSAAETSSQPERTPED